MGQNRMEFGIDLGTTNSSICVLLMESLLYKR